MFDKSESVTAVLRACRARAYSHKLRGPQKEFWTPAERDRADLLTILDDKLDDLKDSMDYSADLRSRFLEQEDVIIQLSRELSRLRDQLGQHVDIELPETPGSGYGGLNK